MNYIEQVLKTYNTKISEISKKELENTFTLTRYKKGDIVAGQNQKEQVFIFLTKGLICSYLADQHGKNYIRTLFTPTSAIASLTSIINQKNINVDYFCLSDCVVLKASYDSFVDLVNKYHDISILFSEISIKEYSKLINRVTQLTTLDARERYLRLREIAPDIENQIPQYQIASYLNITPIQLSRIRRKISKE